MKKSRSIILVSLLVVFAAISLTACSGKLGKYAKKVSEYRDEVFVGSSDNFTAEAVSGYREKPFEIDGVSGEKCDFCIVTISPKNFDPTREYRYKVTLGGVEYEGAFTKHPFENTYSFEVNKRSNENFVVTVDDEEIELASVKDENFITPEKAFEIALKRLGDSKIVKGGEYEIYIRLIANPVNASGGYFWYVAFVDTQKATCAVLIQPDSMEITAVRE